MDCPVPDIFSIHPERFTIERESICNASWKARYAPDRFSLYNEEPVPV
jgi:hypothetical protein